MTLEQERAACARFMGYEVRKQEIDGDVWIKHVAPGITAMIRAWHPDQDDPASREQLEGIKAKMRELKYAYSCSYDPNNQGYDAEIVTDDDIFQSESKISEGHALVAVVAELQAERDKT